MYFLIVFIVFLSLAGTRRTASRPEHNPVTMNGHTEPGIHRQSRQGSGREDRREKRESSGSNSSGGSVGNGKEVERKPTVYQKPPKDDRRPPKDVQRSPKDERRSPIDDRRLPKDDHRPPKDGRRSPKDERRSPKVDRKPREERRRDNAENAVVAVPTTENGGGRLERDKIIMADGTEIHLFDDEEDPQKDLERQKLKKDEVGFAFHLFVVFIKCFCFLLFYTCYLFVFFRLEFCFLSV